MPILNWAYIAGFLDGEGNIRMPNGSTNGLHGVLSPQITIVQCGLRGLEVITAMNAFLNENGIRASKIIVHRQKPYLDRYNLCINNRAGVGRLLTSVMPYLWVKRVEAQDALRSMKLFPSIVGYHLRKSEVSIAA